MIYYVSGHWDMSEKDFNKKYSYMLRTCALEGHSFVVGDEPGFDVRAQTLLDSLEATFTVYHLFSKPRNAIGKRRKLKGGFASKLARNRQMTLDSDEDILWIPVDVVENWKRRRAFRAPQACDAFPLSTVKGL